MKKILAMAAAFAMAVSSFAVDLTVGGRAGLDLNFFAWDEDDFDTKVAPGFNINALVNIGITDELGIQPEIGFAHRPVKGEWSESGYSGDIEAAANVLEIPVLVTYKIGINDMFFIQPELGPKLSFTLGKLTSDDGDTEVKSPVNFGIAVGVGCGINLGPGALLIDARYNRDFTKIKDKDDEENIGSFQSVDLSVGYQIKL